MTFDLEGSPKEGKTVLQEIDATGRTSGYLSVTITDGIMSGEWWSADLSRVALLRLHSDAIVTLRHFEPDLAVLSGTLAGDGLSMILQREEPDVLSGFLTMGREHQLSRISGQCEDATCDQMSLTMTAMDGTQTPLQCMRQQGTRFSITAKNAIRGEISGSATLTKKYPLQVDHTYQYIGTSDCVYPMLQVPAFDTWIKAQMASWAAGINQYLDSLTLANGTPGPVERWSVRASAWTDLTMVSGEIISGIITQYNPRSQAYDRSAFIFDVKSNKPEQVNDFVRKGDFTTALYSDAAVTYQIHHASGDENLQSSAVPFRHVALAPNGFVCMTDFSPINGDAWVILDYRKYAGSLKKGALVQDLIKPQ